MGAMLGFVTCTVSISSASRTGRFSFSEVRSIEIRWNVGSFGLALRREAAAVADAAPIKAELQLHFTFWSLDPIAKLQSMPLRFEEEKFDFQLCRPERGRYRDRGAIDKSNTEMALDFVSVGVKVTGVLR